MIAGELPPAAMGTLIGLRLVSIEPGRARFELDADHRHHNPMGTDERGRIIARATSTCLTHDRVGRISTWGLNGYLNLEQVFDLHENRTVSQFGLSFSTR